MNGTVNANNASSTVYFEYGVTAAYGTTIAATPSTVTGTTTTAVTVSLTGLTKQTTYHYRVVSVNSAGISYGSDLTFLTLPDPLVLNATATDVTGCYGNSNGGVTTTVSGGVMPYAYLWNNGATTASVTGVTSGYYSVTVTDAYNATISGSWFVSQTANLVVTGTATPASCPTIADGSIDITVTGGTPPYQYLWSTDATTEDITGLAVGNYTVTVTDFNGCMKVQSYYVDYTSLTCSNTFVFGFVNNVVCYSATNTITVAEAPFTFTVVAGGNASFIAGSKIIYKPGTKVLLGGKMTGKIMPNGPFCSVAPIAAAAVATGKDELPVVTERASFSLYPNPTNGNFTVVQKGDASFGNVKVEVYTMNGEKVMTESMIGQKQHEFSFAEMQNGLYFVKVIADDYVETIKLVKTR